MAQAPQAPSGQAASPAGSPATVPTLPALTVEAPAKKKAAPRVQAAKRQAGPNSAAPATSAPSSATADAGATGTAATPPGGNPYADPTAAYKVDRLAQTKLTEPLLDTPRTVTTIPKEVIADKGATSLRELARTTPGVTLGTGEGGNPFGDRLFIRGFDARNDAYINGVRDSGVPIRENFNSEQVEILKGPSATIGGRGSSGGAVNVVTKQAADDNFAIGTATVGTDNTKRTTVDVNRAVSKTFSFRVNGMWQNADVAGRDSVFDDRYGGALAIAWKPTEAFKLTADYYMVRMDQLPDWGVPYNARVRLPFPETGVDRTNYYGFPDRDFQKSKQDVLTAGVESRITKDVTVTSKFRYSLSGVDYVAAAPETVNLTNANPSLWTVQSRPKSRWQENEVIANQTDLTAKFTTSGLRHTLVTGFEISQEVVTRDGYAGLQSEAFNAPPAAPPGTLILNIQRPATEGFVFLGSPKRNGRPAIVDVETRSIYALDTIKFNEQWILTVGIRGDQYNLSYKQYNANGTLTNLGREDFIVNYNVGLTYKPLPNGSIYAAYGTSANPVGQELDGSGDSYGGIGANNQLLDPELNTSVEFGTKWELFRRHLLATAAVFQTEKDNARESRGGIIFSTGKYRLRGLELGVGGKVTSALSVYGGMVAMQSEVLESATATNIGKQFANIAHESFNMVAKYELTGWLTIGGAATYRSSIFAGTLAANDNKIPNYWRFDAFTDIKLNDRLTLQVQGLNLTDEVYYDAVYRGQPFTYTAPGRAAYATIKVKY